MNDPVGGAGTGERGRHGPGGQQAAGRSRRHSYRLPGGSMPYVASGDNAGQTAAGRNSLAATAQEAAALDNAAARMAGMPMPVGPAGARDKDGERERTTSLREEDDVFSPDDDVAPPLIG
ncbi:hypothetical protein [Actinoallomurus sp. CA-142502]|uniref:hypothetical protein n=1 Tax=Actinoallomurus sp. CA-142502 TaxID=3239885 RepID=UPI003D8FFADA